MNWVNGDLLLKEGNWIIRRASDTKAKLWHIHHGGAALEWSTKGLGTMRCHKCGAKPPAALRGLLMITNWER